jgi:hypothetical protein
MNAYSAVAESLYYYTSDTLPSINRSYINRRVGSDTWTGAKFYDLQATNPSSPISASSYYVIYLRARPHIESISGKMKSLDDFKFMAGNTATLEDISSTSKTSGTSGTSYMFVPNKSGGKLERDTTTGKIVFPTVTTPSDNQAATKKILEQIANYFDDFYNYLEKEDSGDFIVVLDKEFRTRAAYYSARPISEWRGSNATTTAINDSVLKFGSGGSMGSTILGAYPKIYGIPDKTISSSMVG